jgi:uncharacterized membrane protein
MVVPLTMSLTRLARTFFSGLAVVLPIFVTIALILWLIGAVEDTLGAIFRFIAPAAPYYPGLGLLAALLFIFSVGVLMEALLFRRVMTWLEELLEHIPLVKTVYGAVRDLMSLFSRSGTAGFTKVVLVKWPGSNVQMLGFVTLEDFTGLPVSPGPGQIAVYLPMSYQIGGHTIFVPRECLTPLNMTLEEAMRFVVTAGMSRS